MPSNTPPNEYRRRHGSRTRSRSPSLYHETHHRRHHHRSSRDRTRSPHRRHDEGHRRHKRHRSRSPAPRPVVLPYNAKKLHKHQFNEYRPLFQSYLDIQKQIILDDLDEREAKGRWKSFVGKWNKCELARSWYDPSMLKTAQETVQSYRQVSPERRPRASPEYGDRNEAGLQSDEEDDDFGPALPTDIASRHAGHGPSMPKMDDIAMRNELLEEDRARDRTNYVEDMRYERKLERKTQKDRLEELVPRADPGSRERQLEKKRETTSTLRDFRDAKEGGDVEVGEADLMGDDGIGEYKKQKVEMERKKNEREIRREEVLRAKAEEREERLAGRRAKEAQTMEYLHAIARERFG